jgi:hypothetical protein
MGAWTDEVKERSAFTLPFGPTTRKQIIHDHVRAHITISVIEIPEVEPDESLGFFGLKIGSEILLRFKYVGQGAPRNVATRQQRLLAKQTYDEQMTFALTGDAALEPPTLLTCGYTIDGDKIGRVEIRCDCKGHIAWSYDIYGGDTVIAPQTLPGQKDTTKPARIKKAAAQGEDAASANGAS